MKKRIAIAAGAVALTLAGGAALAHDRHGHGERYKADRAGTMHQSGDMMQMHRMMKGMHRNMMDGGMMDGGMMDGGMMDGGMMDGGMMDGGHMKMGRAFHDKLDTDGDGQVTPEEARTQLGKWLEENDANGDGTLSIEEFEVLHSRLIREKMVDRFQHLDADGDGQVTAEEMTAPAKKLERMQKMRKMRGKMMPDAESMNGNDMQQGGMSDDE